MNKLGIFATFIILFVLYQFLKTIYYYGVRHWREGMNSKCNCKKTGCTCLDNEQCGSNCK